MEEHHTGHIVKILFVVTIKVKNLVINRRRKSGEELYEELYSILYNKFGLLSFEDKQI